MTEITWERLSVQVSSGIHKCNISPKTEHFTPHSDYCFLSVEYVSMGRVLEFSSTGSLFVQEILCQNNQ